MNFTIGKGIPEAEIAVLLKAAAKKYGTFEDNRINYKDADIAPIVMCTIICKDKILLVKRAYGLADAEGYWSTVNGFIDEIKPVTEQVKQEVREELSIEITDSHIQVRPSYTLQNPKEKRRYIVFPSLVTLTHRPKIILNAENTDFVWIHRKELDSYETLDDLPYAIDIALGT